jgi:taurine--2-oxoglutarate transaminase
MAKGITSGYLPFGCLMVTDTISALATACAAALEVIKIYETDYLIENTINRGHYVNKCVDDLKEIYPCIGYFRNTRLLGCIELGKNRDTKEPMAPYNV